MPKPNGFELFRGPVLQGKDSYVLKSPGPVSVGQSRSHEFWQFDHQGRQLNHWRPRYDCDCEYGLRTEYELRDFTLLEYRGKTNDCSTDDSWHWKVDVILNVSGRLDPDSPEAEALRQAACLA